MTSCTWAKSKLSWHIDNELDADERTELETHLEECPDCLGELLSLRSADRVLKRVAPTLKVEPTGDPVVMAREAVRRGRSQIRWRRIGIGFAAAAAAVVVGFFGYWSLINVQELSDNHSIVVAGAESVFAGSNPVYRVIVTDDVTKKPVEGARVGVRVLGARGRVLASVWAVSDLHGVATPRVTIPEDADEAVQLVVDVDGESVTRGLIVRRDFKVLLSTDKPLYQPSQTVHLRALAVHGHSMKPLAGDKIEFEIEDPAGNKVYRRAAESSAFGIASLDFELADEVIFGRYRLRARVRGVESERDFEVKKYVLPKFKVELTLDRPYYAPGQNVRGRVCAAYFFGKPVAGGEVEVKGPETIKGRTNDEGVFEFEARLPYAGDARATFAATITDGADHVERGAASAPVTSSPLQVCAIPEGGAWVVGLPNRVFVVASYADGRPAKAKLFIGAVKAETGEDGVATVELPADLQRETIRARDAAGLEGTTEISARAFATNRDFALRLDRVRYRGGDTMRIGALAAFRTGTLYVDVVKGGQAIVSQTLDVRDGRGEAAIDLPADLFGTLRVSAYRILSDGNITCDQRVVFVSLPDGLVIRPVARKDVHKPGDEMIIDFEVTDAEGRPTPAALGLSVVDEALQALVEERPGFEKIYFAIEEDLLRPRWQLKGFDAPALSIDGLSDGAAIARLSNATPGGPAGSLTSRTYAQRLYELQMKVAEQNEWMYGILTGAGTYILYAFGVWFLLVFLTGLGLGLAALVRGQYAALVGVILGVTVFAALCGEFGMAMVFVILVATGLALFGSFELSQSIRIGRAPIMLTIAAGVLSFLFFVPEFGARHQDECLKVAAPPPPKPAFDTWNLSSGGSRMLPAPTTPLPPVHSIGEHGAHWESTSAIRVPAPPRVRELFPETLYWNPELITDDRGRATLTIPGADSITTWRMMVGAVSRSGRLGAAESGLRVFQDFFVDVDLPIALTQGDEISLPVALYNYLKEDQTVTLTVEPAPWFELLDGATREVALKPNDVTSVYFRVRARGVGFHKFTVQAVGSKMSDAVRRGVEVVPDGKEFVAAQGDLLQGRAERTVEIPADAIEGGTGAWVRLYPSRLSEVLTGLESLVQLPYG